VGIISNGVKIYLPCKIAVGARRYLNSPRTPTKSIFNLTKLSNYRLGTYAGGIVAPPLQVQVMDPSVCEVGVITKFLASTEESIPVTSAVITPAVTEKAPILVKASVATPKLV
jgi:hypothetical protein